MFGEDRPNVAIELNGSRHGCNRCRPDDLPTAGQRSKKDPAGHGPESASVHGITVILDSHHRMPTLKNAVRRSPLWAPPVSLGSQDRKPGNAWGWQERDGVTDSFAKQDESEAWAMLRLVLEARNERTTTLLQKKMQRARAIQRNRSGSSFYPVGNRTERVTSLAVTKRCFAGARRCALACHQTPRPSP